jgi:hypothetical protein
VLYSTRRFRIQEDGIGSSFEKVWRVLW